MLTATRSPLRRTACVALVLTQLTACTTWRPIPTPDPQGGATHIAHARVRLRDGSELSLRDVTVGADTVIGYDESSSERRARPLTDVGSIDRLQVSAGRGFLVAGSALLVVAAVGAVVIASAVGSGVGSVFGK